MARPYLAGYMLSEKLVLGAGLWIPNLLLTEEGEDMLLSIVAYVGYRF